MYIYIYTLLFIFSKDWSLSIAMLVFAGVIQYLSKSIGSTTTVENPQLKIWTAMKATQMINMEFCDSS